MHAPLARVPEALTHYQLLKVQPDAPESVIRAAYRALASQHHPDRAQAGDPATHQLMARINAAYAVLMDPRQRAAYDQSLSLDTAALPPRRATSMRRPTGPDARSTDSSEPDTRVEVGWMGPEPEAPAPRWRREWALVGAAALVALVVGGWISYHQRLRAQAEQALAANIHDAPLPAASEAAPAPLDAQSVSFVLPQAEAESEWARPEAPASAPEAGETGEAASAAAGASAAASPPPAAAPTARFPGPTAAAPAPRHPLDGQPLRLKPEAAVPEVSLPAY